MTNLDNRLQKILTDTFRFKLKNNDYPKEINVTVDIEADMGEALAAIKQVFRDEGYVQMAYSSYKGEIGGKPIDEVLKTKDKHMTGPEWLARFEPLLEDIDLNSKTRYQQIKKAARRASGVDDD